MLLYTIRPYIRPKIWLIPDYDSAVLSPKIMIRSFIKGTWHQSGTCEKQQSGNNTNTISLDILFVLFPLCCFTYRRDIILLYLRVRFIVVYIDHRGSTELRWVKVTSISFQHNSFAWFTTLSTNNIFDNLMWRRLRWSMTENCLPHSVQITSFMFSCLDVWDDPWLKTVYHTQYR